MDQTAVEVAMVQRASDGSGSNRRRDKSMEGAMVGARDGSGSKRWIREHSKERRITQQSIDQEVIEGAKDQRAIERAMDLGAID